MAYNGAVKGGDQNKQALRRRIDALAFALYETELYLDTHPADERALRARQVYAQRTDEAVAEYERAFGPYILTARDVPAGSEWTWLRSPWPWEQGEAC